MAGLSDRNLPFLVVGIGGAGDGRCVGFPGLHPARTEYLYGLGQDRHERPATRRTGVPRPLVPAKAETQPLRFWIPAFERRTRLRYALRNP